MITNKSRVLLVDDFDMALFMARKVLTELGFAQVDAVQDGEQALARLTAALAENRPYDLVLADWNMPHVDGLELLMRCRSSADFRRIPFVLVTSETEQSAVDRAMASGATDYITKPFNRDTFAARLRRINERLHSEHAATGPKKGRDVA